MLPFNSPVGGFKMVRVTMDYRAEQKIEMASTRSGLELWMEKLELEHHGGDFIQQLVNYTPELGYTKII